MFVPPLPAVQGQQIAVWNGLAGGNTVIQPLLQYGAAGTYQNQWIIVNELATDNGDTQAFDATPVQPGDLIETSVYVDINSTCSDYDNGQGCSWWCSYSICPGGSNCGNWVVRHFTPTTYPHVPTDVVFNQAFVGSVEIQEPSYFCNYLPYANYVEFGLSGIYEPGPGWDQFQYASDSYLQEGPPGLAQYPSSSGNCQYAWYTSGQYFLLLFNPTTGGGPYSN